MTEIYPEPYAYTKKNRVQTNMKQRLYDYFKLLVWRYYFKKIANKSHFVFVSEWMQRMFLEFVKIDPALINGRTSIIYNGIGRLFEQHSYQPEVPKKYDFVTIRNNLDGSKYAIDVVTDIARHHPQYRFCVIGRGDFYQYYDKPDNLEWIDESLSHEGIINYLNLSRCALMPTRADSQGVMVCEMATFGIPVITSDIGVCTEVFAGFANVGYIRNDARTRDIAPLFNQLIDGLPYEKHQRYFFSRTILQEGQLFKDIVEQGG